MSATSPSPATGHAGMAAEHDSVRLHPRLSVSAMCTYSWPFERELAFWTEIGTRHAGLVGNKIAADPEGWMGRLDAADIRASTMITAPFDLADPASWVRSHAIQCAAIDLMAAHRGHSIYFTPGRTTGARWSEDLDRLADALAPTVAHARSTGVLPAIEPSLRPSLSFVNNLRDAIIVAERTGVKIVADFGNMWMERDFREAMADAMPHIGLVQIGDIVIGSRENPPPGGRAHIGAGDLPIRRMIEDVLDAGYDGVFDLEIVGPDHTADCDEPALRRGILATSSLLHDMGI